MFFLPSSLSLLPPSLPPSLFPPSIHHGLDSNNQVEVEAAIYATSCLVKHSPTFAAGVCEKIAAAVQGSMVIYSSCVYYLVPFHSRSSSTSRDEVMSHSHSESDAS